MDNHVMPPEIAKAIVAVKKRIRTLGHDEQNKFQGFRYTSVDAFYAAVGPLMAEAGLFTIVDEAAPPTVETRETTDDRGQTKSGKWLSTNYDIRLFHESGACYGPIHRTMVVRASGPQSFGQGMSYVDKYFLRGMFKVPTGEVGEVDSHEQNGLPETHVDWVAVEESGNAILAQAKSLDDLRMLWQSLSHHQQQVCGACKDELKSALTPKADTHQPTPTPITPPAAEAAAAVSPLITRWVGLIGIAGKDLIAMNSLIRDDFVPLQASAPQRNEIWTLIQNQGRANGWLWSREAMRFFVSES